MAFAVTSRRAILCVCTALVTSSGAFAQQQTAQSGGLEEIVVTAQKRSESLGTVPISINVITGQTLADYKMTEFRDVAHYIPNFSVGKSAASDGISIRGIGSGAGSLNFEQSVALFVDGVYGGRSHQFQAPFLDLERIEILRGPQGGLAGKNTTSGAVNLITAKPTDVFEASVNASYEFELKGKELTGVISGPLTEKFKARVAARFEDTDGWVRNPSNANKMEPSASRYAGRFTGVLDASDNLTLTGKAEFSQVKEDGCFYETKAPTDPIVMTRVNACNGFPFTGDKEYDYTKSYNGTLTADLQLGGGFNLTSITAYSAFDWSKFTDGDFSEVSFSGARFKENFHQFSEELRLLSPTGKFVEYVAGVYFHKNWQHTTRISLLNVGTQFGTTVRDYNQDTKTLSTFGQVTLNLTDKLSAKGSLRYTHEPKEGHVTRARTGTVAVTNLITPIDGRRVENQWDPGASVQYQFTPSFMAFASYAHGSKGGGFTGDSSTVTAANWGFEPESSYSYEGGFKLNGSKTRLFVTVFHTRYKNQQVTVLRPDAPIFETKNVGVAQSEGVEVEGAWSPLEGLTINASGAYLKAKYVFYPNGNCLYPRDTIPGCVQDRSNTPFDTPTWTGSMRADYTTPITDSLNLLIGVGMNYQSNTFRYGNPRCALAAYAKIDGRLGVEAADGKWRAALRGRNLGDKGTWTGCPATPLRAGYYTFNSEPPRTIALEFGVKF